MWAPVTIGTHAWLVLILCARLRKLGFGLDYTDAGYKPSIVILVITMTTVFR